MTDMKGKTIRIYLVDGTPTGILTTEIINWTGKVIVAPRGKLADLASRAEVKRTGIYCLVGPDPANPSGETTCTRGKGMGWPQRPEHHGHLLFAGAGERVRAGGKNTFGSRCDTTCDTTRKK